MMGRADTGAIASRQRFNVVVYEKASGEILQCAALRPHRVADFPFPGEVLVLPEPREVCPEAEMVNPSTLAIEPRPGSGVLGQAGSAPFALDLSWCPPGAHLILQNEDGETLEAELPLENDLILTDPGRYFVTLRGSFPFQDFFGEIEVANA